MSPLPWGRGGAAADPVVQQDTRACDEWGDSRDPYTCARAGGRQPLGRGAPVRDRWQAAAAAEPA
ncbi:hypothetical protein GCM10018787_50890 [Streptomyces thermodiastaticus]|nr:hypothetical protein GCM10018787_50890 [Streptomyces thermodiastaticus]